MADALDFALRVVEDGDALLLFPERVGELVRFGYYHGRWTVVTAVDESITASEIDRERVKNAIDGNTNDVEIQRGREDYAWYWFLNKGTDEQPMHRSHCMCGAFKCSTDVNTVMNWRTRHASDCQHDPNIIYSDEHGDDS